MYGGGGGGGGGGQYDGGGGNANMLFSGGGFMPSQSTAVPESSGFSKGRSAQTLLPLTVKQIMDATQGSEDKSNYVIDGVEVSTVRLVGRMLEKVQHITDVKFKLDDGTGKIEVTRWESDSSENKELVDVNDGDYVIVNGGLKSFQGKRTIVAYSVRGVTNFNEIPHHFLHCIQVHLDHTRPKAHITASTATPGHTNQVRLPNNQAAPFSASVNAAGNDIFKLVTSVFHDPAAIDREHGLNIKDVADHLKLSEDVIRSVIQVEVENGNIYNTIDDNHFKSALNG